MRFAVFITRTKKRRENARPGVKNITAAVLKLQSLQLRTKKLKLSDLPIGMKLLRLHHFVCYTLGMTKAKYRFSLPVVMFREGKNYIAYTPSLDLSTSGKSYEQAKKRFEEVVEIFFEEVQERGTLEKVLTELGWEKVKREWTPPAIVATETQTFQFPLSS